MNGQGLSCVPRIKRDALRGWTYADILEWRHIFTLFETAPIKEQARISDRVLIGQIFYKRPPGKSEKHDDTPDKPGTLFGAYKPKLTPLVFFSFVHQVHLKPIKKAQNLFHGISPASGQ
jgi:hypothetical protein